MGGWGVIVILLDAYRWPAALRFLQPPSFFSPYNAVAINGNSIWMSFVGLNGRGTGVGACVLEVGGHSQ